MSARYAWLGQSESDRLEDANIVQLRSTRGERLIDLLNLDSPSSSGGSAPGVDADPFSNSYPEADWSALVAALCFVLIFLALLYSWLGIPNA